MLYRPHGISFVCESTLEAKPACGGMYSGNLLCCSYKFLLNEDLNIQGDERWLNWTAHEVSSYSKMAEIWDKAEK